MNQRGKYKRRYEAGIIDAQGMHQSQFYADDLDTVMQRAKAMLQSKNLKSRLVAVFIIDQKRYTRLSADW